MSAGSLLQMFGSLIQGEASAMSYEYNSAIARQNASIARSQGVAAIEAQKRTAARTIGAATAAYGASGVQVDGGSPLDVLADSARMAVLDSLTLKYNYDLRAMGYDQNATLATMGAKNARTASYFQAAGSFNGGGMSGGTNQGTAIPIYGD